jgi:hypothetical protein
MLKYFYELLPLWDKEAGGSGSSDEASKDEKDKESGSADDKSQASGSDELAEIEKRLEANRAAILSDSKELNQGSSESKPGESSAATKPGESGSSDIKGKMVEINDEFISKAKENKDFEGLEPDLVTKALTEMKGEPFTPKGLKSYVHSQVALLKAKSGGDNGKAATETKETIETDGDENIDYSERFDANYGKLTKDEKQNVEQAKSKAIYANLKEKYPELKPEDLTNRDSLNDFISSLAISKPLDADDFKADYADAVKLISKSVDEYVDRTMNWAEYMRNEAKAELKKFEGYLSKRGLKLSDMTEGEEINEAFIIKNILTGSDKNLKADLINYYKGNEAIPMLNRDKFYQSLIEHFDDRVISLTKQGGINNYLQTRKERDGHPSLSNSSAGGRENKDGTTKTLIPNETIDVEEMDKILEENRKAIILDSKGHPYG